MTRTPDFKLQGSGQDTVFILYPISEAAKEWRLEHLPPEAASWAGGLVIEHRFIDDVLIALDAEGYTIEEV